MKLHSKPASWFLAAVLLWPAVALASDFTGVIPFILGGIVVITVVGSGVVCVGLYLLFRFTRLRQFMKPALIWLLLPVLAIASFFVIVNQAFVDPERNDITRGHYAQGRSGWVAAVSPRFGEPELDRLFARVQSRPFHQDVERYAGPTPELDCSLVLNPGGDDGGFGSRRVQIGLPSAVSQDNRTMIAMSYLFSKAVREIDPAPCEILPPEPPLVSEVPATQPVAPPRDSAG